MVSRGRAYCVIRGFRGRVLWLLNSNWHHGNGHSSAVVGMPSSKTCSTPIGITGTGIHQHPHTGQTRRLLNANWHHGDGHPQHLLDTAADNKCSTPIGITGTVMTSTGAWASNTFECSTPIGITGTVIQGCRDSRIDRQSCSTPIGITGTVMACWQFLGIAMVSSMRIKKAWLASHFFGDPSTAVWFH